jgi:hypothetical protein
MVKGEAGASNKKSQYIDGMSNKDGGGPPKQQVTDALLLFGLGRNQQLLFRFQSLLLGKLLALSRRHGKELLGGMLHVPALITRTSTTPAWQEHPPRPSAFSANKPTAIRTREVVSRLASQLDSHGGQAP